MNGNAVLATLRAEQAHEVRRSQRCARTLLRAQWYTLSS